MWRWLGAAVFVTCVTACAAEDESRTVTRGVSAPEVAPTPGVSVPVVEDPILALGAKKTRDVTSTFSVAEVDAEALGRAPSLEPAELTSRQREKVAASPIPVLLPGDAGLRETAHLSVGAHWAAASMVGDGHTVYVQGSRGVHEVPSIELSAVGDELTRKPYSITRIHQILTISFERFGIAYHIDVECDRQMVDPRCTEDDYAIGLMEGLLVVRGGER